MLKPRDIIVLLKVKIWEKNRWTYKELAESLEISSSEVHTSLKNCAKSSLYINRSRRVLNSALKEFLIHGIRYSFPAQPGAWVRGIPTAHSAEPLKGMLIANQNSSYVWALKDGQALGQAIEPLHKCVPRVVQKDPAFYQLLSLVDGLRVGRARELDLASRELDKIIVT